MPSPTPPYTPVHDSAPYTLNKSVNHYPTSPSSSPRPQSSWKSVFRFPNASSKKLAAPGSPVLVEAHAPPSSAQSSVSHIPVTSTASLNPAYLSDQRSSYNSSNTQSSDSINGGTAHRNPYMTPQGTNYPQPKSTDALSVAAPSGSQRPHTKSERARPNLSRFPQSPSIRIPKRTLTADASQISYPPTPSTPSSKSRPNGPLSPKSVGASASRFIRRVASAPNAKGLFSMGSKSSTTKNGFLAPAETVPPIPALVSSSLEHGQDSLETVSSGSSRGRISRPSPNSATLAPLNSAAVANGLLPVPEKVAFRRTYSSNSIKVRQVRSWWFLL